MSLKMKRHDFTESGYLYIYHGFDFYKQGRPSHIDVCRWNRTFLEQNQRKQIIVSGGYFDEGAKPIKRCEFSKSFFYFKMQCC